jgi:hypothetical protein
MCAEASQKREARVNYMRGLVYQDARGGESGYSDRWSFVCVGRCVFVVVIGSTFVSATEKRRKGKKSVGTFVCIVPGIFLSFHSLSSVPLLYNTNTKSPTPSHVAHSDPPAPSSCTTSPSAAIASSVSPSTRALPGKQAGASTARPRASKAYSSWVSAPCVGVRMGVYLFVVGGVASKLLRSTLT